MSERGVGGSGVLGEGAAAVAEGAGTWTRIAGVTLRPWSGASPVRLIVAGALQCVILVVLFVVGSRMLAAGDEVGANATAAESSYLQGLLVLVAIVVVGAALVGVAKLIVGILDLVPRRTVHGTVVSLRDRKLGDILPLPVQRLIWERGNAGTDRRKRRTELVLDTADGHKAWTVQNYKTQRELRLGTAVTISVSPIVGYVAKVEPRA